MAPDKRFKIVLLLSLGIAGCTGSLPQKKPGEKFPLQVRILNTEINGIYVNLRVEVMGGGFRLIQFREADEFSARDLGEILEKNSLAKIQVEMTPNGGLNGVRILDNDRPGVDPLQKMLTQFFTALSNLSNYFSGSAGDKGS